MVFRNADSHQGHMHRHTREALPGPELMIASEAMINNGTVQMTLAIINLPRSRASRTVDRENRTSK